MNVEPDLSLYVTWPPAVSAASQVVKTQSGAHCLVEALLALGVDTVFGCPGSSTLPLHGAVLRTRGLRYVLARHEQAAVHAAQGYARTTGRVGVVLVAPGPGVSSTTTGLFDAMCDSDPIVCLSGQVSTHLIGTDAFQECDALGLSRPVTKWSVQLREIAALGATLRKAFSVATSGRPGPVLVDFPKDVQVATWARTDDEARAARDTPRNLPRWARSHSLPTNAVKRAAQMIAEAQRPVLHGGGGLLSSGRAACDAFAELARRTGAPVTLTMMGLGAFPASHPQCLGMLGRHGTAEANLAMHHADLVVCLGARFAENLAGDLGSFCPSAKVIHVDVDPTSINKVVLADVPLVGDCGKVLRGINAELSARTLDEARLGGWWRQVDLWREVRTPRFAKTKDGIEPQELMTRLHTALTNREAIVSTDVGQHQILAAQHLRFDRPYGWLTSGGAGTMGYGLPAAIGAQIAHPDKLVVCLSDETSILFNIQELVTAVGNLLPVKVVLFNGTDMEAARDPAQDGHRGHCHLATSADFVAVARGFGWQARRVTNRHELDLALAVCLNSSTPYFLDVQLDSEENWLPTFPTGRCNREALPTDDPPCGST